MLNKASLIISLLSLKEYIIPGVVTFVIIAGLASYWLFYRRKHV